MVKTAPPRLGFNKYKVIDDKTAEFYIHSPKYGDHTVTIDLDDLDRLIELDQPWHIRMVDGYMHVQTCIYGRDENNKYKLMEQPYLQRWVMGLGYKTDKRVADHWNHDPFDNRRENIRITTDFYNTKSRKGKNKNNTSGYRNVGWDKRTNDWMVQLQDNGKNTVWRGFKTPEEAAEFARIKRKELYGEFAGED